MAKSVWYRYSNLFFRWEKTTIRLPTITIFNPLYTVFNIIYHIVFIDTYFPRYIIIQGLLQLRAHPSFDTTYSVALIYWQCYCSKYISLSPFLEIKKILYQSVHTAVDYMLVSFQDATFDCTVQSEGPFWAPLFWNTTTTSSRCLYSVKLYDLISIQDPFRKKNLMAPRFIPKDERRPPPFYGLSFWRSFPYIIIRKIQTKYIELSSTHNSFGRALFIRGHSYQGGCSIATRLIN